MYIHYYYIRLLLITITYYYYSWARPEPGPYWLFPIGYSLLAYGIQGMASMGQGAINLIYEILSNTLYINV